ncbi:MAG: oxidoreductase [Candidatus Latescibacterota bacterium]
MPFPRLFSPIRLGRVEIPNRLVMAPMGVGRYRDDENWALQAIRYFEERAAGGVGLILTQTVRVHSRLASRPGIGLYDDRQIPSHAELVERTHRHGAKIFCQLGLQGGKGGNEAPSAVYSVNYKVKPRSLVLDELYELVESFVAAAGRAVEAGYDGVEVHGAHTYLLGALMSPALNRREDEWGGDFERRMKFVCDAITGIKHKFPGLPVGFKFSAYEEIPGGVDIPLGLEIARYVAALGVDYLHVSSTASTIEVYSRYASVPPLYLPRNTLLPLAEGVKKACPDTVVMGTGSITTPEEAEMFIAEGACDMVALGRTLIADPFWPAKARRGETNRIIPCIRCNVCHHQLWLGKFICCSLNPYVSREAEQDLPPAARKKNIMVVGAGPAGVRCALTAAKRGHMVTLY